MFVVQQQYVFIHECVKHILDERTRVSSRFTSVKQNGEVGTELSQLLDRNLFCLVLMGRITRTPCIDAALSYTCRTRSGLCCVKTAEVMQMPFGGRLVWVQRTLYMDTFDGDMWRRPVVAYLEVGQCIVHCSPAQRPRRTSAFEFLWTLILIYVACHPVHCADCLTKGEPLCFDF